MWRSKGLRKGRKKSEIIFWGQNIPGGMKSEMWSRSETWLLILKNKIEKEQRD